MTRLEKKCFIAASGTHGLLLVILLVGPAFLTSKDQVQPVQLISVLSGKVVDDALTSGGSSVALPPPPSISQQQQEPNPPVPPVHNDPPKHEVTPEPPKHDPKPEKNLEPEPKPKTHVTTLNPTDLKLVKPKSNNTSQADDRQKREAEAQHQRDLANQRAAAVNSAVRSLNSKFGKAVAIDVGPVGNGGEAMTRYGDIVSSIYYGAWNHIPSVGDERPSVTARIVIAKSGKVIDWEITKRSGNSALDHSVQAALENVTFIEPFPAGSSDSQRTFTIHFDPQAKQGLG